MGHRRCCCQWCAKTWGLGPDADEMTHSGQDHKDIRFIEKVFKYQVFGLVLDKRSRAAIFFIFFVLTAVGTGLAFSKV